jgi:hypothetical protein
MPHDHPEVRVSPIFPVTGLPRALAHYAALGCSVTTHDETYGFAARAGVQRTGAPVDTDYGLREGWHIDPDGDLLRFGSPLASRT